MQKLFRQTTLMDAYPCNFNVLIAGMPRVMGVGEILEEGPPGGASASSGGSISSWARNGTSSIC